MDNERLDAILAELAYLRERVDALHAKRESHGAKRKTAKDRHDESVAKVNVRKAIAAPFLSWCDMRREKGESDSSYYLTDSSIRLVVNKLHKYPDDIAIQALQRATESCWRSVFPESIAQARSGDDLLGKDWYN